MDFSYPKGSKQVLQDWGLPVLILIAVTVFTVAAVWLYEINETKYLKAKSERTAEAIAETLSHELHNRSAVLKILGHDLHVNDPKTFTAHAKAAIQEFPDFYAINIVSPEGVIKMIYPVEKNELALGKNLFEKEVARGYLTDSKNSGQPRMSHKLMTYQGVSAFVLYIPMFDASGKFTGWLNGVVDFDSWLSNFLKTNRFKDVRVVIKWDHPGSAVIDLGQKVVGEYFQYKYTLMNQNMVLGIGFAPSAIDSVRENYYRFVIAVGSSVLLLALVLVVLFNASRLRFRALSQNLLAKNNLLTSLCHDISTPLTTLNICLEPLISNNGSVNSRSQKYIDNSLRVMEEMISSVRLLHAQDMGVLNVELKAVNLNSAVEKTVEMITPALKTKGIRINVETSTEPLTVMAEASILTNNVLSNILSNAIKFSPAGGQISIRTFRKDGQTLLVIDDEGEGLCNEQVISFKKFGRVSRHSGTMGEKGTGLGLIQIQSFMHYFGGKTLIENIEPKGCRVTLVFT